MAAGWKCSGDVRKSLIYKMILLENARNTLNEELCRFTEKTADEIQEFLNPTSTAHNQDGANLLKTLDAKCCVIKELMVAFENVKTAPDLQNFKTHLTQGAGLSPQRVPEWRVQVNRNGAFVPKVLKFGPLLHNVILASSISKALKIISATAFIQQMTLSLELKEEEKKEGEEEEELPGKISSSSGTEIELINQVQELKMCKITNAKFNMQQNTVVTEAEIQKKATDTFIPKGIHPNLPQNVTAHILEQQFGNDPEVQHQKQTSSQLMRFLRVNGKTKNVPVISLFTAYAFMPRQQKNKNEAVDQKGVGLHTTHRRQLFSEMTVSGPIFKVKNRSAGFVTYSCMIATCSELWDIGDISTETIDVTESLHDSIYDQGSAFPDCDDPKLLDPFSQTLWTSSDESSDVASEQTEHLYDSEERSTESVEDDDFLLRIPEFEIKKFEEMCVLASHVVSPSNFYIQREEANLKKLSETMAKINSKSYAERSCIPDIGSYVMGWFPKQELWCRGRVTKICGMNRGFNTGSSRLCTSSEGVHNLEVEVQRIDFGDSACLSLSNVKDLCGEAAEVPVQALQVSLANVNPLDGENWSVEAVGWFKDKVDNRTLYTRLFPKGNTVMVEIFLEKGKIGTMRRGASLSLRLAQNGHARHSQMKTVGPKRSHAQNKSRKQSVEWEKYLISCYSQSRK